MKCSFVVISKLYVNRITSRLPAAQLHLNSPVSSITSDRATSKVILTTAAGAVEEFDHVIMATHSDTSLKILGADATELEKQILGAFGWAHNEVVVHHDLDVRYLSHAFCGS